jgi:hypothetical protein
MFQSLIESALKATLPKLVQEIVKSLDIKKTFELWEANKANQPNETNTKLRNRYLVTNTLKSERKTMDMVDGCKKDFAVLGPVNIEGKQYLALAEVGSPKYEIWAMCTVEGYVNLSVIEDDDEFDRVFAKFEALLLKYDEES